MKIVDFNTFIQLPIGTVYCEASPCIFGDLAIKQDSIFKDGFGIDWFYTDLTGNPEYDCDIYSEAFEPMINGENIKPDFYVQQRDGMYEYDRTFMVYTKKDVKRMIKRLKKLV